MNARRLLIALVVALLPFSASAQLDDLLVPLGPSKKEEDTVKKKKKKRKKRRSSRKRRRSKERKAPDRDKADQDELPTDSLVVPLVPQKGELLVKVTGPKDGVTVTVNGRVVKANEKLELDPGPYEVVVKRPGWTGVTRKILLEAGQNLELPASLDAVAGVLTVTADVPGSLVWVDGERVGPVPVEGLLLKPGSHEVVVRQEGFEDNVSNLSIRAGRDYTVKGNLKPKEGTTTLVASSGDRPEATRLVPEDPGMSQDYGLTTEDPGVQAQGPWYSRWYVWAGVGAVAVAAVTSAVVVSANSGPPSLSPEDVCGGPCDDVINPPAALRF